MSKDAPENLQTVAQLSIIFLLKRQLTVQYLEGSTFSSRLGRLQKLMQYSSNEGSPGIDTDTLDSTLLLFL